MTPEEWLARSPFRSVPAAIRAAAGLKPKPAGSSKRPVARKLDAPRHLVRIQKKAALYDWLRGLSEAGALAAMTPWEQGFTRDVLERLKRDGLKAEISQKEFQVGERLAQRYHKFLI